MAASRILISALGFFPLVAGSAGTPAPTSPLTTAPVSLGFAAPPAPIPVPTVTPWPGPTPTIIPTALAPMSPAFNPCDPAWQLDTADRNAALLSPNHNFVEFENLLQAGGARWIGSRTLPKPWRAIVRVDHFKIGTKQNPRSAAWYLAAIPIDPPTTRTWAALGAIDRFRDKEPVFSRKLGYCLTNRTFTVTQPPAASNLKITHVVTEYDPRCTCVTRVNATMQVWITEDEYDRTPAPTS